MAGQGNPATWVNESLHYTAASEYHASWFYYVWPQTIEHPGTTCPDPTPTPSPSASPTPSTDPSPSTSPSPSTDPSPSTSPDPSPSTTPEPSTSPQPTVPPDNTEPGGNPPTRITVHNFCVTDGLRKFVRRLDGKLDKVWFKNDASCDIGVPLEETGM